MNISYEYQSKPPQRNGASRLVVSVIGLLALGIGVTVGTAGAQNRNAAQPLATPGPTTTVTATVVSTVTATPSATPAPTVTVSVAPSRGSEIAPPVEEKVVSSTATTNIKDGVWLVGEEIRPGTYRHVATGDYGSCSWSRLRDLSGNYSSKIASDFTLESTMVTIELTDMAFQSDGCTWTFVE